MKNIIALLVLSFSTLINATESPPSSQPFWDDVITGKSLIIMRHALAPGTGDPDNFSVDQCDTQRNLSQKGHQQAIEIGKTFRQYGVQSARVYSSQWCRCLDTATGLNLGDTQQQPLLNSFYSRPELGLPQIKELTKWLGTLDSDKPVVLVTHQVVISALTGVYPSSGDAVIFRVTDDNTIQVEGTLAAE